MDLPTKLAIAQTAITSISNQGDLDTGLRAAALAQVSAFCTSETARINAELQATIASSTTPAPPTS